MKKARDLAVILVAVLGFAGPASALTLTNNPSIAATGGRIPGAGAEIFNVQVNDNRTFWWADASGTGLMNAATANLNMAGYTLKRISDTNGITLNLYNGTANGSVTNGGTITTSQGASYHGNWIDSITITNAAMVQVSVIDSHNTSAHYDAGRILLANVGDVAVTSLVCGLGSGGPTWGVIIQQTGNLAVGTITNQTENVSSRAGGPITLTGGGTGAGNCSIGSIVQNSCENGDVTIQNYKSVAIGANGIDARDIANATATHFAGNVFIQNIGVGGVTVSGNILEGTITNSPSGNTPTGVVITNIAGSVQVGNIDTHSADWGVTVANNDGPGSVIVSNVAGNVSVGNLTTYYGTTTGAGNKKAGDIMITSSAGGVSVGSLDARQACNSSAYKAGNATLTAYGNLSVTGSVISLSAAYGAANRGVLSLTTSPGSGGSIYVNSQTTDVFDISLMQAAQFSSDSGSSYLAGTLTNFDTTATSGSGTLASPYITTQTALRSVAGQKLYYNYVAGGLNEYLDNSVYQVANLAGIAGAGGLLVGVPIGAPAIANVGASNITTSSAALVGNLTTGNAPVSVTCYWGPSDGGTVAGKWAHADTCGTQVPGLVTNSVAGLTGGQAYYFRYFAGNSLGGIWSPGTTSFYALGAPAVDNGSGASAIDVSSATLNGTLDAGYPSPSVWIYWGTTDGGTTKGNWSHATSLGQPGLTGFSAGVSSLQNNQMYWYRCCASNNYGEAWATASTNFTTLSGAPTVTNQAPSSVGAGAAILNGQIVSTGAAPVTAVTVYWGTADGGTNATLWTHTNAFAGGPWISGVVLATNITTLNRSQNYYYAFFAANSYGGTWATPSTHFPADGFFWMQDHELIASDGTAYDQFGTSVSEDGYRVIVGTTSHAGHGMVYVYDWDGTNWNQTAEFSATDSTAGDAFGSSVSFISNRMVVGAYGKTVNGNVGQGAAYVYDWNGALWVQKAELTNADGAAFDFFGSSVSLSGNRVVVGAYDKTVSGKSSQGAAYVYDWNGTNWHQTAELIASNGAANNDFGASVSLSGNRAVVGAYGKAASQGAAYVYDWNGTSWTQTAELAAMDGASGDSLGWAVSLSGDRVVVGADGKNTNQGAAYVYDWSGTNWTQTAEVIASDGWPSDYFGFSVSLNGNQVLIGAKGASAAYVFEGNGTNWVQGEKLSPPAGSEAGYSVALSGSCAVIGAHFATVSGYFAQGAAYVYDESTQRNTPPIANNQSVAGIAGASQIPVALSYTDPDPGQSWTFELVAAPSRGTLKYSSGGTLYDLPANIWFGSGIWFYMPTGTNTGTDHFTWKICDGLSTSGVATATVSLMAASAPNPPPRFKAGVPLMDGSNVLSVWRQAVGAQYVYANAKVVKGPAMAAPELVDWNNDGLVDLVVGETDGRIALFINHGTVGNPVFNGYTYLKNLDGSYIMTPCLGCCCFGGSSAYAAPRIVDWNNDGKKDLIIGDWHGNDAVHNVPELFFYVLPNLATDNAPVFDTGSAYSCPFQPTIPDTGFSGGRPTSMPCIADLNGDGILDVISGENNIWFSTDGMYGGPDAPSGLINVYFGTQKDHRNPASFVGGSASGVAPSTVIGGACPVQSRKSVVAADLTGSGRKDLLVGMQDGSVWYSPNIGTPQIPAFTNCVLLTTVGGAPVIVGNTNLFGQDLGWANAPSDRHKSDFLNYGSEARLAVADLDGDGLPDLVVGDVNGHVTYYQQYNPKPVAIDQRLVVMKNKPANITLTARMDSGSSVTFTVVSRLLQGTLAGTAPNLVYTPATNYTGGSESFAFQAASGGLLSRTATVFITVADYMPVAQTQSVAIATMNLPRPITLLATDAGGLPLTYSLASLPSNGSCSVTGNVVIYAPSANYTGPDSFTWKATNGYRDSSICTVSVDVTVLAVNFQPTTNAIPAGYVMDDGSMTNAARGYGWDKCRTNQTICWTRDPDSRLDTCMSSTTSATWTCSLPNGNYYVTLAYGTPNEGFAYQDPVFQDKITVEGMIVVSNSAGLSGNDHRAYGLVGNIPVTVSNGQLTVIIGNNANSSPTRLDYLEIRQVYRPMGWATFVAADTSTRGSWQGVYGTEGYWIPKQIDYNDYVLSAVSLPAYATVSGPSFSIPVGSGSGAATVADPSTDVRALQHLGNATRIQSYCNGYGAGSWSSWDVNIVDGLTHRVEMYCVDWWGGRAETVSVLDANDNTVLDTRTLSNYTNGTFLVWDLTGHVIIQVTGTLGTPVFSGLFFGSGSSQDWNQDGLPDGWQIQYYGNCLASNAAPNAIALNGLSNQQNYRMGLDPLNANASAPAITEQPANQIVTLGQAATFSVTATGTAPLSYQWSMNAAAIGGATDATYTTPATVLGDNGATFSVVVTNVVGCAASSNATLTVNVAAMAPMITAQPTNATVTAGQTATFSVGATGTAPLSYQWQANGVNMNGGTSTSYTTGATTTNDSGGQFQTVVSNPYGCVTSTVATLIVNTLNVASYAESFEDLGGWGGLYTNIVGSKGWFSSSQADDNSQITNLLYTYIPANFPLPGATHTNVLMFDTRGAELSTGFGTGFDMRSAATYVDMMMQFVLCDNQPDAYTTGDSGVKAGVYANASSNLVVYHGVAATDGTLLSNTVDTTAVIIDPTNWYRLTFSIDATASNQANALVMFQVKINGLSVTNSGAFPEGWKAQFNASGRLPATCSTGSWFRLATTNGIAKSLTTISFNGKGYADDLVATNADPFALETSGGTFALIVVKSVNGWSSLGAAPFEAVTVAAGVMTQVVYVANDWYRIGALAANGAPVAAAGGARVFTQSLANIGADLSNDVSFALATPSQTGFDNVPTIWLTNWPEALVRSGLDAYDVPTKYQLGLDPTVSNEYALALHAFAVSGSNVVLEVQRKVTGALSPDGMHGQLILQGAATLDAGFTNITSTAVTGAAAFDDSGCRTYTNAVDGTVRFFKAIIK